MIQHFGYIEPEKKKRAAARLLGATRQQTEKKGKRKNLEEVEAEVR